MHFFPEKDLKIFTYWKFLPFYAILRSIPDKLGGVVAMVGAILILLTIPFTSRAEIRSPNFRPLYRILFWFIFFDFVVLGWIGQKLVETPYIEIGQIATILYFLAFGFFIPLIGTLEKKLII